MDSLKVKMDTEEGVKLNKLKEQLRSKYNSIKKVETRQSLRNEMILNKMDKNKHKILYKTKYNKEDK